MARRSWFLAAALMLSAGCGLHLGARSPSPAPGAQASAVGLIAEGSAFAQSGMRDAVVRAVESGSGRRVVLIDPKAPEIDARRTSLATALTKADKSVAKYDWREPHCASDAVVLLALHHHVDAIYRVTLEHASTMRPPTPAEAQELSRRAKPVRAVLGGVGLARRDTVAEETVSGSVVLTSFGSAVESRRTRVARTLTRLEPTPFGARLDVGAAVADALRALPAVPTPAWDRVARRLTTTGCPVLALAVHDAHLQSAAKHKDVKTAALKEMRRNVGKRTAKQLAEAASARFRAALEQGNVEEASQILARYAADPACSPDTVKKLTQALETARTASAALAPIEPVEPEPSAAEDNEKSCRSLCSLHMVEICNNDRALWSSNRSTWEATACGRKRDEAFLQDCYRQQWLNGAFESACVVPCEGSPEGRNRLISILQDAGCSRPRTF
jgi:hypothetical protein